MSRSFLRWLPAFVVPVVVVTAVIAVPLQAGAAVDLPDKTAEQVLLMVSDGATATFSGTVVQSTDLGLPNVDVGAAMTPSMRQSMSEGVTAEGSGSLRGAESARAVSTVLGLLSGSRTARVFSGGPALLRVQIMDRMEERDLVLNGDDVWLYESSGNVATHLRLPAELSSTAQTKIAAMKSGLPADLTTPAQFAERFLSELDPSTTVSVGADARVAGRSVYQLILTPKTDDTLVESVSIAVDSETGLPLELTVRARGQNAPAFHVAFTAIDYSLPNAELFTFTPPADATVHDDPISAAPTGAAKDHPAGHDSPTAGDPVVTGSGWSSVIELPADAVPAELSRDPLIDQLTSAVDGGRALTTALVTMLLTADGRVFAGAVPLERLQAAAR